MNCVGPDRDGTSCGEVNVSSWTMSLPSRPIAYYINELLNKRGSKREVALPPIIQILTNYKGTQFVEDNFATTMFRLLDSLKKGSIKETALAAHALGLLAMTVNCRVKAHELYEESTPLLSEALKHSANTTRILDSLAIITFFCGDNLVDVEKTMLTIWNNIHQDTDSSKRDRAHKINVWSFLLSTLEGWRVSKKHWKGAISYFSSLLEDETVHDTALESLALIYEMGAPDKFYGEFKTSECESFQDLIISSEKHMSTAELNENILNLIASILPDCDLGQFQRFQKKTLKFGKENVVLSTYGQRAQLNFISDFLGRKGLEVHIQENELVRDVFEPKNCKPQSGSTLYIPEEKQPVKYYLVPPVKPLPKKKELEEDEEEELFFVCEKKAQVAERMNQSPCSRKCKAWTQLLNQKRRISHETKMGAFRPE